MSERTELLAEAWGHWILAWTLVFMAVTLWIRIQRPSRPAIRYGGWLLATFAGAALMPVIVVVGPRVSWSEVLGLIRSAPAVVDPSDRAIAFRSWFDDQPPSFRPEPVWARGDRREDRRAERAEFLMPSGDAELPSSRVDPPQFRAVDRWLMIAAGIWATGFLVFATRLLRAALCIRSLLARLEPIAPDGLEPELEAARRALRLARRVRVRTHPRIAAPMCIGLVRPVILWPTQENCPMSRSERLASLSHELAHLRHGDDWVALLAEIWRSLTWFYPPVHLAVACARRERDLCLARQCSYNHRSPVRAGSESFAATTWRPPCWRHPRIMPNGCWTSPRWQARRRLRSWPRQFWGGRVWRTESSESCAAI